MPLCRPRSPPLPLPPPLPPPPPKEYINAAAAAPDPLERMKLLLTWVVAGMWKGFDAWKKPFNPILGETWQAELEGGVQLFMEQARGGGAGCVCVWGGTARGLLSRARAPLSFVPCFAVGAPARPSRLRRRRPGRPHPTPPRPRRPPPPR